MPKTRIEKIHANEKNIDTEANLRFGITSEKKAKSNSKWNYKKKPRIRKTLSNYGFTMLPIQIQMKPKMHFSNLKENDKNV